MKLTIQSSMVAAGAALLLAATVVPAAYADEGHDHAAPAAAVGGEPVAVVASNSTPDHEPLAEPISISMPMMDAEKGKVLFIEKACITCHAINGVGGMDGPRIDAHVYAPVVNAFEFAARMWNHSQGMVAFQIAAFEEQIYITAEELAHITAFVHSDAMQHTMTEADIPPRVREMMHHEHGEATADDDHGADGQAMPAMTTAADGDHGHSPGTPPHID